MGYFKNKQIEDWGNGHCSTGNIFICSCHFEDYAIINFIDNHGSIGTCTYCQSDKTDIVSFDNLVAFILDGLTRHYGDVDNEINRYNGETGEYDYPVMSSSELIRDYVSLVSEDDDEILGDIANTFVTEAWCRRDPYLPDVHRELLDDWGEFCLLIKHKARYIFLEYPKKHDSEEKRHSRSVSSILKEIGRFINGLRLVRNTNQDSSLFHTLNMFRARQHKRLVKIDSADKIATAPKEYAATNRFSPAGIPMFYASSDIKTAVFEVIDRKKKGEYVTVAEFINTRPLNLVDLTNIPVISIFDLQRAEYYDACLFLHSFAEQVSKPIKKRGTELFEYVPTQVVTEYFRYVYSHKYKVPIDGIMYKSSRSGKVCYVIFAESEDCEGTTGQSEGTATVKLKAKKFMRLPVKDIKRSLSKNTKFFNTD